MSPQRRNGDFSACWDERARSGVWRCLSVASGCVRVDSTKKKSKKNLSRLGWFFCRCRQSTPGLVFLAFYFGCVYNESCAAVTYVTRGAQIRSLFCRHNTGTPRTGTAGKNPASSALARGRSGAFQRRSINEAPNPRGRPSDGLGGSRAARGVSSWSLFRCLCFSVGRCVAQRSTGRR